MSQKSGGVASFSVGGCLEFAAAGILIVHVGPTRTVIATVRESRLRRVHNVDLIPAMAFLASEGPTTSDYLRGVLCGLSAVCIWAAFIVVSRLGVRTSLTPWDVAAIRFAVAGVILLPYLWRRGLALDRLRWQGVAAVAVGCGAPMVLLVNAGLLFAPAAHGGALFPG